MGLEKDGELNTICLQHLVRYHKNDKIKDGNTHAEERDNRVHILELRKQKNRVPDLANTRNLNLKQVIGEAKKPPELY